MPVFKNEEKLSPEYVPEKLLFREEELKLLFSYFSSVISLSYITPKSTYLLPLFLFFFLSEFLNFIPSLGHIIRLSWKKVWHLEQ
jgi:hypothetical protein